MQVLISALWKQAIWAVSSSASTEQHLDYAS